MKGFRFDWDLYACLLGQLNTQTHINTYTLTYVHIYIYVRQESTKSAGNSGAL